MADHVGERFGDYQLLRFLGEGTFGDVYLGEHVYKKTPAAVKVFKTTLTPDKFKDFLTEVRTVLLRHPNIVPILDFGIGEGDIPFLVMEYAPNGTLLQHHPRGTLLPLSRIVTYVTQIAAGLQYAHDERRIHRDVKPENMLLGPNNEILLSDFGLAVVAHTPSSQRAENAIGTARYMAPEQWEGKPLAASDQYAVGIIVYEWLGGESPFAGGTLQLMYQHIQVPPPPFKKDSKIPPQVEQAVMTALAKDPQQRFASVQAFAIALEQATVGTQLIMPASPPSQPPASALPPTVYAPYSPLASPIPPTQKTFTSPSPISAPVPSITSVDFPMFGYDLAHTHFNPHEHILSPANVSRLVPLWSAPTGAAIASSSPAVANGVVYVGSEDTKLYAFEAATGKPLWSAPTGGYILSSPAVANGVLYVGSRDGKLYAFEAGTGKTLWSAPTGGPTNSSPAVESGVVYVGSNDHKLYAFEAGTGKPLWNAPTGAAIASSSPAVANGVLYVGSGDYKLYAFEAGTGKPLWSAPTGGPISSPAVANGVLYVGSRDGKLYAFEATTGKPLWSAPTSSYIDSSPAVANGVVYVGAGDKKLYAFEAGTGKTLWSTPTGDAITSSPAVANGVVYVGSWDTKLYAFEANTGKPLWSTTTGDFITSSPAVANGVLYVGSNDTKLYAFHLP